MSNNNTKSIEEEYVEFREKYLTKLSEIRHIWYEKLAQQIMSSTKDLLAQGIVPKSFTLHKVLNESKNPVILISFEFLISFPDELMNDTSSLYKEYLDEATILTDIPYDDDILAEFEKLLDDSNFVETAPILLPGEKGIIFPLDINTY